MNMSVYSFLVYFGSLALGLISMGVSLISGGKNARVCFFVIVLNVLCFSCCYLFVRVCKWMGYKDWYYANYSYVLVNLVFVFIFILLLIKGLKGK